MARVTPTGIVGRDLTGYKALFESRARGKFGDDIALDPETPLGELIGIMASSATEVDEVIVRVANSLSLRRSQDLEIDTHGELLDIRRHRATRSRVTLTATGVTGTTIPARSRVRNNAGVEFQTVADAVIPNPGTVDVVAEAVQTGPVAAAAGTLTTILTQVAGWETVTNAAAAIPGVTRESNQGYRSRALASTGRLARGPVDAIQAALIEARATDFRIEVNDTSAVRPVGAFDIPSHSIFVIVKGGQDADIAAALVRSKGLGVGTFAGAGDQAVSLGGIHFRRPAEVAVAITLNVTIDEAFPSDGVTEIQRNLAAYAVGTWRGGTGQFDTRGFRIGEGVDLRRLQSPINAVPGHEITALAVTDTNAAALPAVTPTDRLYTLAADAVTVVVTT